MSERKELIILNLTGELSSELREYFASRKVKVIDPLVDTESYDWTHIIVKDIHQFDLIGKTYEVLQKNRHIISLSKVSDLRNFTLYNGNIIIDDLWLNSTMGGFILDKYFQGYGGISLSDNYPTFKEEGSFNIANPFSTGEYLDRMVQKAFETNIDALSVKTCFDHLIMYVAGLKAQGKVGLPFEVTYGTYNDVFAVQIHFFSQALSVVDVSMSLSSTLSKKAEEYYLNVAVQSADFFDFSFMPELGKVMATALWTTDKRIQFENRGLMFSSLTGGAALLEYVVPENSSPMIVGGEEISDFSEKVVLADKPEELFSQIVKGSKAGAEEVQVIKGSDFPDSDDTQLVKGAPVETDDEVAILKGDKALEELVQTIRGKFEEDKSVIKISGSKLDVDKFAYTVASNIDETTKEKNLKVRSLGNQLSQTIKTGLFDFAKGLNKSVEELSDQDLDNFQVQKIPEIFKSELETQIKISKDQASAPGSMTVKSLPQQQSVVPGPANQELVKQLETRLLTEKTENEKLRTQLKALTSEVRILKESRNKLAEIQMKATQAANEINVKGNDEEDKIRQHYQKKLEDQKSLNDQDLKRLSIMLEKQSKLVSDFRTVETKARRLELEAVQKETFFAAELEKSERQIKAKDLMLLKTKETFTKLIEKKDSQLAELTNKNDQLTKTLSSAASLGQAQAIKDLEKQNQNLSKQLENYKNKITSLATNLQPTKSDETLKEEFRKLQMINQQMKNQVDASKREVEKLQSKSALETAQLNQLKQDKTKLEAELKKATFEAKQAQNVPVAPNDQELKRLQAQNQILETQVKDSAQKITVLENKLLEVTKNAQKTVATTGEDNSKVKLAQLENSVKKLTQDLVQARNQLADEKKETNKLRQDKTALQNQLDKLKKEADKAKPAAPKKPGGKAA